MKLKMTAMAKALRGVTVMKNPFRMTWTIMNKTANSNGNLADTLYN